MRTALLLVLLGAACGAPGRRQPAVGGDGALRSPVLLPEIAIGPDQLDARALAAEAAFLFPDQTRALVGSLLRGELARREARRLGLEVDAETLERSLTEAVDGIRATLAEGEGLEDWARERFGRSWPEAREALRRHLAENQLYQLAVRAEARSHPRYRLHMLVSRDRGQCETWARKLRAGADPTVLARESREPGPAGDGSLPPLPPYLPEPLRELLEDAPVGEVVGPLQLAGDPNWRVLRLAERLPAAAPAPVAVLLTELREQPLAPLEARAWFEEMARRYTASNALPGIQGPAIRFVRPEASSH